MLSGARGNKKPVVGRSVQSVNRLAGLARRGKVRIIAFGAPAWALKVGAFSSGQETVAPENNVASHVDKLPKSLGVLIVQRAKNQPSRLSKKA